MRFAWILIKIVSAVRSDVDFERTSLEDEVCVLKTCTAATAGHYEVHGTEAQQLSGQLRPQQQYFVATSCEPNQPSDAKASVVQWLDAEDPVNNSSIHIYMDPLMKTMLQGEPAKLCAKEADSWQCLCKLQGNTEFGAFKWLAPAMPSTVSQKWLAMHLQCPSGAMDLFTAIVLLLLLPVAIVSPYAAWNAWHASEPQIPFEFKSVQVKNPMQNFVEGFSWSAGFLLSLAALQMGTLLFVRKSSEEEVFVWFIAAFPAILAMAGAVRLGNIICKMQLAHACLGQGCLLTGPMESSYLDFASLTLLISYLLAVLWSVSSSIMNIILALVALAGSTWALLKAIQTTRALEKKLKTLEVNADFVSEVPTLKLVAWKALISAGRRKDNIYDLLSKTEVHGNPRSSDTADVDVDVKDINIGDIFWHGRAIFHLTSSRAGFLVLPSLVALVIASLIITASQVTMYACSRGQLNNLQLTGFHSLEFQPWQTRYEVLVDTSFRQVTLVASSDASTTQWINLTQPNMWAPMQMKMTDNSSGSMVAEIQLSPRHVPRISHVYVKGLRVSLDPVEYQVRFSPLKTLPTTVKITAPDFETKLAWSQLPGSIISVPAGSDDFMIEVTLTDFVFNFPLKAEKHEERGRELWTEFEAVNSSNEATCRTKCHRKPTCFDFFVSDHGCFFVEGNTTKLESHVSNISTGWTWSSTSSSLSRSRQVSGEFHGCTQMSETSELGRCPNGTVHTDGVLQFRGIRPDWRGNSANLAFTLTLHVGGQTFASEVQSIQLRHGPPIANDVLGVLLAQENSQIKLIKTNLWVDSAGNVVVNVSRFDPSNITTLNLSVMPLLPDPAFEVQWDVTTNLEVPRDFPSYAKCKESPLLSERYKLCGAANGFDTKPITIQVDPWTGRLETALRFTVVPKKLVKDKKDEALVSEPHMVHMNFQVDSPAAWAAEFHSCTLLDRNVSVEKSLFESADATCQLLTSCSNQTLEELCKSIKENALGGREVWVQGTSQHVPALLSPQRILKVLACLKDVDVGHWECRLPTDWYHDSPGILQLYGYGAQVPVKFWATHLQEMEETKALAWLQAMHVTSESMDQPALFDQQLAKTAWEVGQIKTLPKLLRILGHWKSDMPQILLDELVASRRMELMDLTPQPILSEIFYQVKTLNADLADASDLCFTILALNLAENLESLTVKCFQCNDFAKVPSAKDWNHLSRQIAKIEHLRLEHFILTDLGKFLSQAKKLKSLTLTHDQLVTLPQEVFRGLSSLGTLNLEHNQLTTIPETVFRNLSNLGNLNLDWNELTTLPQQVFRDLSSLKTLNLHNNKFTTLPQDVFRNLSSLKTLELRSNRLTTLPQEVFRNLSSLANLNLKSNKLPTLPQEVFHDLSSLETLNLHYNNLITLPQEVFRNLSSLKTLELGSNRRLTTLPKDVFRNLSTLENLELCNNKLTTLPREVFRNLSSLKTLELGSNRLTALPQEVFRNLYSLETLNLKSNKLPTLPQEVFHDLPNLRTLSLRYNLLTTLPQEVFRNLSSLETLNLGSNSLITLPQQVFRDLSSLKTLELGSNQLTTLPQEVFRNLSSLENLKLEWNKITTLPKEVFRNLSSLRTLRVGGKGNFNEDDIPGLSNLRARGVRTLF